MLLTTGDNSYLAATPDLFDPNLFEQLRGLQARAPNLGVVGDHDIVFELGRRALVDTLEWPGGGDRFDVDYGPVQFIGIGLRGEADDRAFLARALRRSTPEVRFLLVHQPLKAGNPLLPVIERSGLAAVLSGHLHAYERRSVEGAPSVPQFTVGTGGASASSFATPAATTPPCICASSVCRASTFAAAACATASWAPRERCATNWSAGRSPE